jgi:hypothetical protein
LKGGEGLGRADQHPFKQAANINLIVASAGPFMPEEPSMTTPNVEKPATTGTGKAPLSPQDYERLVRQIADRVWKLWREDLRRSQERANPRSGR